MSDFDKLIDQWLEREYFSSFDHDEEYRKEQENGKYNNERIQSRSDRD